MTDMFPNAPITIEAQIDSVTREIRMRQSVYAHRVDQRKMTQHQADKELTAMCAVLQTLNLVKDLANPGDHYTVDGTVSMRQIRTMFGFGPFDPSPKKPQLRN